jgi:hypothetical protein
MSNDTIRKDAIIKFIEEYEDEEKSCFNNDVSDKIDYQVKAADFYDIVARHNQYFESNWKSPLIIAIKEDGICTGDYITLEIYQDMFSRWYTYIQTHGKDPEYVLVNGKHQDDSSVPPINTGRGKEMWTAADSRWTRRTGYTNPIEQVNSYDCSVHSVMEVIYAMLGKDLSENAMVNTALQNGWLGYEGASHYQLEQTLSHFSDNQLQISWVNFDTIGFEGIERLLDDPQRDFIVHGAIDCSDGYWGHYFLIRQSSYVLSRLSELRSICGAQQEHIISEDTFKNRVGWISQPSIGIVNYK